MLCVVLDGDIVHVDVDLGARDEEFVVSVVHLKLPMTVIPSSALEWTSKTSPLYGM